MPRVAKGRKVTGGPRNARGSRRRAGPGPRSGTYTLRSLDQIKVLADPLRLRILESFCHGERTTKQVAEEIGEKPTKLYHHVDALERVGVIEPTRTRRNRGTLEKYYVAVARSFKAASDLLDSKPRGADKGTLPAMVDTIFDKTAGELSRLIDRGKAGQGIQEEGALCYVEIHASEKEIRRMRSAVQRLLRSVQKTDTGGKGSRASGSGDRRYRLTLAFFPLDL